MEVEVVAGRGAGSREEERSTEEGEAMVESEVDRSLEVSEREGVGNELQRRRGKEGKKEVSFDSGWGGRTMTRRAFFPLLLRERTYLKCEDQLRIQRMERGY